MVGSILRQAVIELQGQTRHMPCVCEIRIKECSPGLNTQQNGGLNLLALRQCGAPNAPERVSAEHFISVFIQPARALFLDDGVPAGARSFILEGAYSQSGGPKHIEIVNLA